MAKSDYFSLFNNVVINNVEIVDIFKRIILKEKFKDDNNLYFNYKISDGQTPDSLARNFYDDPQLYWIILASNDMKDFFYDWPMTDIELRKYVDKKIADEGLDTGQTKDELFEGLTTINESKRIIKYMNPTRVEDLLFELNKTLA